VGARALPYAEAMLERRAAGEPLQYALGRWGFRRLDLLVDRRVLIPRPETEQVVEVALRLAASAPPDAEPVMVDLGTGSGAIALSLAQETPAGQVWATDVSPDALQVAKANLAGMGGRAATRVRLAQGSWWDALPPELQGRISLAVSNPPYVPSADIASLPAEVRGWEPALALDGGSDGLDAVRQIVAAAPEWLGPAGILILELGDGQAAGAAELVRSAGMVVAGVHPDLAGRDRVLVAVNSS
jgi:release factor glutamine methyltransferase